MTRWETRKYLIFNKTKIILFQYMYYQIMRLYDKYQKKLCKHKKKFNCKKLKYF